jgi:hypothetical protein
MGLVAGFVAGLDAGFVTGFDAALDAALVAGLVAGFVAGLDASDAGLEVGKEVGLSALLIAERSAGVMDLSILSPEARHFLQCSRNKAGRSDTQGLVRWRPTTV